MRCTISREATKIYKSHFVCLCAYILVPCVNLFIVSQNQSYSWHVIRLDTRLSDDLELMSVVLYRVPLGINYDFHLLPYPVYVEDIIIH